MAFDPPPQAGFTLSPRAFHDIDGWAAADHALALAAFRRSAARHRAAPYKQRAIDFDSATFAQAAEAALALHSFVPADAKRFFESWFAPHRIDTGQGGHVTAYYEPVIEARRVAGPEFGVPFMARPDDLVELSDTEAAAFGPDGMRFARRDGERLCPYPDRAAIETGALAGRGLEIAFVADPVDAFFAHVQGCARLLLPEGEIRVTYDGKSGHPFTGIGRLLVETGQIPRESISMQAIRDWLAAHPDEAPGLMRRNRSYIFFREAPVDDPALGPVAAAKVPLTPLASIAVDRTIHAFGLPFFIDAPSLSGFGPHGFRRLMIAQDTGSAILGPVRADLFMGSGDAAGALAGAVNAPACFHILLPKRTGAGR